jgi:hypothetical protein
MDDGNSLTLIRTRDHAYLTVLPTLTNPEFMRRQPTSLIRTSAASQDEVRLWASFDLR